MKKPKTNLKVFSNYLRGANKVPSILKAPMFCPLVEEQAYVSLEFLDVYILHVTKIVTFYYVNVTRKNVTGYYTFTFKKNVTRYYTVTEKSNTLPLVTRYYTVTHNPGLY